MRRIDADNSSPPILNGADAGGVFALLRNAVRAGLLMPLARLSNRCSSMHFDNSAEVIAAAIRTRCPGTFITTDSKPITPEELYRRMARAAGRSPRLFFAYPTGPIDPS